MIAILGDLHLRSDKDYFIQICKDFLKWFKNWKYNTEENYLILAGDLTDSSTPGGLTISFLEELYNSSRFKEIHICKGNHEEKLVNSLPQLSYEFLTLKPNVFIYREAQEVTIDSQKVLMLPYFVGVNEKKQTMKDYYSSIYMDRHFKNDYDLVVGHFSGDDIPFLQNIGVSNLDKLSGKVCLGHIHTRNVSPERYIGSIFAGKVSENDNTRAAWIFDHGKCLEDPLPLFNEFLRVDYPKTLPRSNALVPVYTVFNCSSETVARDLYGDIFIRKTILGLEETSNSEFSFTRDAESVKKMDLRALLDVFIGEQKPPLSNKIQEDCRDLLERHVS